MATTRDMVEAMYAAANRKDLAAQVTYFASDATYRMDAWDVDLTGRSAIRQLCTRSLDTLPAAHPRPACGGRVVRLPTARDLEIRDGLIRAAREYLDAPRSRSEPEPGT